MKKREYFIGEKNVYVFGIFEGAYYSDDEFYELFKLYKSYKNKIPKESILAHMKLLAKNPFCCGTGVNYDVISGEEIPDICFCRDGDFVFPTDFIYYMEKYGIGIPPEYEEYLKKIIS